MKYKKDYSKCRIEFAYESVVIDDEYRLIYWRIRPEEMTWWDRIFKNTWRKFEYAGSSIMLDWYSVLIYNEELAPIQTYEQAIEYQEKQYRLFDERYRKREAWPQSLNN